MMWCEAHFWGLAMIFGGLALVGCTPWMLIRQMASRAIRLTVVVLSAPIALSLSAMGMAGLHYDDYIELSSLQGNCPVHVHPK